MYNDNILPRREERGMSGYSTPFYSYTGKGYCNLATPEEVAKRPTDNGFKVKRKFAKKHK